VLSALAGRCSRFDIEELAAFWDTVVAVALRTPEPVRRSSPRPASTGPGCCWNSRWTTAQWSPASATRWLRWNKLGEPAHRDYRLALVTIAIGLGRARGPYGRRTTPEDEQMILLIAALLEIESAPGLPEEILV
jgi:hypothetical protein